MNLSFIGITYIRSVGMNFVFADKKELKMQPLKVFAGNSLFSRALLKKCPGNGQYASVIREMLNLSMC